MPNQAGNHDAGAPAGARASRYGHQITSARLVDIRRRNTIRRTAALPTPRTFQLADPALTNLPAAANLKLDGDGSPPAERYDGYFFCQRSENRCRSCTCTLQKSAARVLFQNRQQRANLQIAAAKLDSGPAGR